jgi:glycerate kinase
LIPNAETLDEIVEIIPSFLEFTQQHQTTVLSDVDNPLLEKNGTACIHGP